MIKTEQERKNCLASDLSGMISEFETGQLTKEDIFSHFSTILIDAGVDSRMVVEVLEMKEFGELGKNQALSIKVNEGW